jgi:hypothetical protein
MTQDNESLTDAEIQGLKWIVWLIKAYLKMVNQAKMEQVMEQIIKISVTKRHTTLQERTEIIRDTNQLINKIFIDEVKI